MAAKARPSRPRLRDVVLALVELRPGVTGYEIASITESNVGRFYSTTPAQVYPVLATLLEEGLVNCTESDSDQRGRKEYSITEAGRQAVDRWLAGPVAFFQDYPGFGHFLLEAIFLPAAGDAVLAQRLSDARRDFAEARDYVEDNMTLDREIGFGRLEGAKLERYLAVWNPFMEFMIKDAELKLSLIDRLIEALPLPPAD